MQLQPGRKRLACTYDDQQARENQEYQRGIEHIGTVWLYPLPLRNRWSNAGGSSAVRTSDSSETAEHELA
jgi:hypothetical protein